MVKLIFSFCEFSCSKKSSVSVFLMMEMTSSTNLNHFLGSETLVHELNVLFSKKNFVSFPCLTDEAKGSFGETFHLKTVVRTGVLGIYYWIEVKMESEEEHTGRQMEANTQSGSLKHFWLISLLQLGSFLHSSLTEMRLISCAARDPMSDVAPLATTWNVCQYLFPFRVLSCSWHVPSIGLLAPL